MSNGKSGRREPKGCVHAVLDALFGTRRRKSEVDDGPLPYQKKDFIFSKAERSFYEVLRLAIGDQWTILAKVRLADLMFVKGAGGERQKHQNRIQSKHADFVLCDRESMRPLLAIELDDGSHERSDRIKRDDFVDRAFAAAGLPLLRVPAQRSYDVKNITAQISNLVGKS